MSTISRQIGWSQEANLLFEIYKELEKTVGVTGTYTPNVPTISLYYTPESFVISYLSVVVFCDGNFIGAVGYPLNSTDLQSLLGYLNDPTLSYSIYGKYVDNGNGTIKLLMPVSVKEEICPNGVISFAIFAD
jgi:hypothetical protein